MKSIHFPFHILTIALFIGLIVPVLIQDGMFMDGLLYTCVAKNAGNGIGTFWFPISDATWIIDGVKSFHEHPPLVFAIQSFFFKTLGNSMYVERFYSFLTACITVLLIIFVWREIFKENKEMLKFSWLPVLFWVIVPLTHWTFQNNMQENTMGIFSLSAVYFILKGMKQQNRAFLYISISGIFIFLASFSKGVPGLFPIGAVGLYWLVYKKPSFYKAALYTVILAIIPAVIYYLLIQNPDAKEALSFYLNHRLLGRIEAAHTVSKRFHTIIGLVSHLLPVLIIAAILLMVFKKKSIKNYFEQKKEFLFFILIGLSASLPLMLTLVQKDFYFSHSIPYFGIAFALLLAPGIALLVSKIDMEKKGFRIFKFVAYFLLVFALSFSVYNIGGQSRNSKELHDIHLIGSAIQGTEIIDIDQSIAEQWNTRYYLVRYYNLSSSSGTNNNDYLIIQKENTTSVPNGYQKINLDTEKYELFEKIK
ncbi:MAG: glycosyltransferase family 39 protein [Bacteroidales bacterium]|nr:glycosyltransferase family 39 protein [Bacteroidales bacterium]